MVETYHPKTLEEALIIRSNTNSIPFAGGTDLMVRKRNWSGTTPKFEGPVIFIGNLDELKKIERDGNTLRIGAAVNLSELLKDERVPEVLKLAVREMASPAVRNMGTIGGNICNASPAGDTLPVLYCLGASVILRNKVAVREMPVHSFIKGPGKTALNTDEILTGIVIPSDAFNKVFYRKVGTRKADALSKLSFVGLARISDDVLEDVRIAFGAVAPTVVRVEEVEGKIRGKDLGKVSELVSDIVRSYESFIKPIDDQRSRADYRKTVSLRLVEHFLKALTPAPSPTSGEGNKY